jgi:hypothetical protein
MKKALIHAGQLYNPAGLTALRKKDVTSSYRLMKLDRTLSFVSVSLPTKLQSTLALGWIYAGSGEVKTRGNSGEELGGTLSTGDHAFSAAFAKQFLPVLGTGVKLNYYYKRYNDTGDDNLGANSIGLNLGILLSIDSLYEYGSMEGKPINDIKIGIVAQNLSARYNWSSKTSGLRANPNEPFPVEWGLGISFRVLQRDLLLTFDARKNNKQSFIPRFGGEYLYRQKIALRAGYNQRIITAGMGFEFALGESAGLLFDYAFAQEQTDEGSDHIFSLHVRF